MNDLVDTTEMYLRTVYELEEEGIVPLRARIAERLKQSGPTVSQTVARMERDGLLVVQDDRHLQLTDTGRSRAIAVMRKHRLAEVLLTRVIGMDWDEVHVEACRWEHVMSEQVERKLITLLDNPVEDSHGNPIPGLAELGAKPAPDFPLELQPLAAVATEPGAPAVIRRISEQIQPDVELMRQLSEAGALPGRAVVVRAGRDGGVLVQSEDDGDFAPLDRVVAQHVYVSDE